MTYPNNDLFLGYVQNLDTISKAAILNQNKRFFIDIKKVILGFSKKKSSQSNIGCLKCFSAAFVKQLRFS